MALEAAAYHSRYAPEREAMRYLDRIVGDRRPSLVIIVAGAMNYLGLAAAERFPKAVRILLQPCDDFDGLELDAAHVRWSPGTGAALSDALTMALRPEYLAGGVAVIEWPPLASRYPGETAAVKEALREALERASADAATRRFWAPRWLRNCVRFLRSEPRSLALLPGDSPVLVACAGPSLDDSLDLLQGSEDRVALWALASAVPALLSRGLRPDLVVTTDPGFWNALHQRQAVALGLPAAMPPSAYAPASVLALNPILPLDTGLSFEGAALGALGLRASAAKASGSAAGTALSLALAATTGPVALIGYDLAARGFRDHASGYAFDAIDEARASRLNPAASAAANRVIEAYYGDGSATVTEPSWRRSRAFSAYASGIRPDPGDGARASRYSPSPVDTAIRREPVEALPGLFLSAGRLSSGRRKPRLVASEATAPRGPRDAAARLMDMLAALAAEARALATAAVESGRPLPEAASLYLSALAPMGTAAFQAKAARGDASLAEAHAAIGLAEAAAMGLAC